MMTHGSFTSHSTPLHSRLASTDVVNTLLMPCKHGAASLLPHVQLLTLFQRFPFSLSTTQPAPPLAPLHSPRAQHSPHQGELGPHSFTEVAKAQLAVTPPPLNLPVQLSHTKHRLSKLPAAAPAAFLQRFASCCCFTCCLNCCCCCSRDSQCCQVHCCCRLGLLQPLALGDQHVAADAVTLLPGGEALSSNTTLKTTLDLWWRMNNKTTAAAAQNTLDIYATYTQHDEANLHRCTVPWCM